MQNSLNIIIIGAGLVGLSSADLLALAGHRVTVIESQHGPVYGASYSNSGMLHPSQSWPWLVDKKKGDASTAFKAVHQLNCIIKGRKINSLESNSIILV